MLAIRADSLGQKQALRSTPRLQPVPATKMGWTMRVPADPVERFSTPPRLREEAGPPRSKDASRIFRNGRALGLPSSTSDKSRHELREPLSPGPQSTLCT